MNSDKNNNNKPIFWLTVLETFFEVDESLYLKNYTTYNKLGLFIVYE